MFFDEQYKEKQDENTITECTDLKNLGNNHFHLKQYDQAISQYDKSLQKLQNRSSQKLQQQDNYKTLICAIRNNIIQCYIEQYKYQKAISLANKHLIEFPDQIKTYFKRGVAYLQADQITKAKKDFLTAKKNSKDNNALEADINKYLKILYKMETDQQKCKQITKNMIGSWDSNESILGEYKRCHYNLNKAQQQRINFKNSFEMFKRSLVEDTWEYIDQQVIEEYGFTKLSTHQWDTLYAIYQVIIKNSELFEQNDLENHRKNNMLHEYFKKIFTPDGIFLLAELQQKSQCIYYALYTALELNISL